jgi:uncharacterized protein YjbI with pentapeptide repeats
MIVVAPKLPSVLQKITPPDLESATSLENVELDHTNWSAQIGRRASFDAIRFIEPDMSSAKLREGGWADVEIVGGLLAATDVTGSTLRRVHMHHVRASGLIAVETEAKDILIEDSKLDLSNFRFAKWHTVIFVRCSFLEADFAGAHLKSVVFNNCDLTKCDFSGANLKDVDFRGSIMANIHGLSGLDGSKMTYDQLVGLLPEVASQLGITLAD